MKKQYKTSGEKALNKMEVSDLSNKEFKVTVIPKLPKLGTQIDKVRTSTKRRGGQGGRVGITSPHSAPQLPLCI